MAGRFDGIENGYNAVQTHEVILPLPHNDLGVNSRGQTILQSPK